MSREEQIRRLELDLVRHRAIHDQIHADQREMIRRVHDRWPFAIEAPPADDPDIAAWDEEM